MLVETELLDTLDSLLSGGIADGEVSCHAGCTKLPGVRGIQAIEVQMIVSMRPELSYHFENP